MADREGLTPLHFIALRLCWVRFAEGMVCSLALTLQSNPVLRRGSHPSLAGMVIHAEMVENAFHSSIVEWRTERDSNPR